jgi:hypothetical protein
MSQEHIIDLVASYNDELKDDLVEYCRQVVRFGQVKDRGFDLLIAMGWWERNIPWVPFVRKDRSEEFRECRKEEAKLFASITILENRIKGKLDDFKVKLQAALNDLNVQEKDGKEFQAVGAILQAFREFSKKFSCYNWFFRFGKNETGLSFSQRYPDAQAIYRRVLAKPDS